MARRSRPTAARARALQCPYHGWVYRLDGSLARAAGVGEPEGFDLACSGLFEVRVTTFARCLLVNVDPDAADFDPGPLGRGVEPYRLDRLELGHRDRYECAANWKVIVENYSENYHTPFLHSQLPTTGYEYPMREVGPIVFAWDRPLNPRDASEHALGVEPRRENRAGNGSASAWRRNRSTTAATSRSSPTR